MSSSATIRSRSAGSAGDAAHPAAVVEIPRHRHVRKQPALLEHIADAAAVGRHVDPRGAVEQHVVVERDAAAVRRQQAGDHVDERGLAGAGRPEQRGRAARGLELGGDLKFAEPLFDVDAKASSVSVVAHAGAAGEPLRRDQRGERDDDGDDDEPPRRGVAAGDLRERVDRGRQRLRLARDVGDEGDGGAELAERLGEGTAPCRR